MISTLEKFEDMFPDLNNGREGGIFKAYIRTAFNDVIRAQRDELIDYEIDYRPLRLTDDNILAMTQTLMSTVQRIEFDFRDEPYVKIYCSGLGNRRVLDAVRAEMGTGIITEEGDMILLEIIGVQSCVDCVLPIMDKYRLHADVRPKYSKWRTEVIERYRR